MQMIHGVRSEDYPTENKTAQNAEEGFKICPICGARCFADMEICFGCLHRFSEDESGEAAPLAPSSQAVPAAVALSESAPSHPFDHTHDIISLQKPAEEALTIMEDPRTTSGTEDGLTAHHICSDKNGRQFEIAISIKML